MQAALSGAEEDGGWGEKTTPKAGQTVLDRLHQSMILFAAGRSDALKRFLVEDGIGQGSTLLVAGAGLLGAVSGHLGREAVGGRGARAEEGTWDFNRIRRMHRMKTLALSCAL